MILWMHPIVKFSSISRTTKYLKTTRILYINNKEYRVVQLYSSLYSSFQCCINTINTMVSIIECVNLVMNFIAKVHLFFVEFLSFIPKKTFIKKSWILIWIWASTLILKLKGRDESFLQLRNNGCVGRFQEF